MHEWSLLLFTLSLQIAAGGVLSLAVVQYLGGNKASSREITFFAAVACVGASFSLTHLGDMFGAYRALYNFGSSWLSREAWIAGAFAGTTALCALLAWRGKRWNALLAVAALLGLAAVHASSAVYSGTVMEKWTGAGPSAEFFASAFLVGPFLVALPRLENRRDVALLGSLGAAGLILLMAGSGFLRGNAYPALTAARFLVAGIGVVAAVFVLASSRTGKAIAAFAVVCLVLGEGLGRYIFFME